MQGLEYAIVGDLGGTNVERLKVPSYRLARKQKGARLGRDTRQGDIQLGQMG